MGKGRMRKMSLKIFEDNINDGINNNKYKRLISDSNLKKTDKYLFASDGLAHIARRHSFTNSSAKEAFMCLTKRIRSHYENVDLSFNRHELYGKLKVYTEVNDSLFSLHDNAKRFFMNKFHFNDLAELCLYSLINKNTTEITNAYDFISPFVDENILQIYQRQRKLRFAIMYDGIIKSINKIMVDSFKNSKYVAIDGSTEELKTFLVGEASHRNGSCDHRNDYLQIYLENISFYASYSDFSKAGCNQSRKVYKLLNIDTLFKGTEGNDSISRLINQYNHYPKNYSIYNEYSFKNLLCLQNFNNQTNLIDLYLMSINNDIPFYKITGLLTKYNLHIASLENVEMLDAYKQKKMVDFKTHKSYNNDTLQLHSRHANDNFMIDNLNERDYEFLNSLVDRTSKIFNEYYLNDINPKKLMEIVDTISEELEISHPFDMFDLPKTIKVETEDYRDIYEYKKGDIL